MKMVIDIRCASKTCGHCPHKEQHSNMYPEMYRCNIFGQQLRIKSGTWKTGLSFHRLLKCLRAEQLYNKETK